MYWTLNPSRIDNTRLKIYIAIFVGIFAIWSINVLNTNKKMIKQRFIGQKKMIEQIKKNENNIQQIKYIAKKIIQVQPKLDVEVALLIAKSIDKYSQEYDIPVNLIIAIIKRESTFRLTLTSNAGCKGLMQINPSAHPEKINELKIQDENEIFFIDNNINLGCWIFNEYYNNTIDIKSALTKYVGGKHPEYIEDILSTFAELTIFDQKGEK